jgi:hypothetical protein
MFPSSGIQRTARRCIQEDGNILWKRRSFGYWKCFRLQEYSGLHGAVSKKMATFFGKDEVSDTGNVSVFRLRKGDTDPGESSE